MFPRRSFEQNLLNSLVEQTGHRMKKKNLLAWSVSKSWIESIQDETEEAVFLPGLEVWCLVRSNVKRSGSQLLNKAAA